MYIRQRQIFVGIITMMIIVVMMMVGDDDIIMEIVGCWQCNESKIRYSYGKTFVAIFLISYLIHYS